MTTSPTPRPGGRSARIQAAVHQAVRELQDEQGRAELTVPAIANRADVTPSTIYRRWGDLTQLLADVAIEQLQPDRPPVDTGSLQGDLRAWLVEYFEEMSSAPVRAMLRDVLGTPNHASAGKCDGFLRQQIEAINERALARQESPVNPENVIQVVVAPLLYRILFANEAPSKQAVETLFEQLAMPARA